MACPRVEGAEQGETGVISVPVGIILSQQREHFAVVVAEVIVHQCQQGTGQREVAVVEVMVVVGIGIEAAVVANHSAVAAVAGKEVVVLSGRVGQPVHEGGLQLVTTLFKQFLLSHLTGKHHVQSHLRQTLTAPVGVRAEVACIGITLEHLQHHAFLIGMVGVVILVRHGIVRQHAEKVIVNLKARSFHQFHLSVRRSKMIELRTWQVG